MKKLLVLTLTALTITGLVGCGASDSKSEGSKQNSQIEQQESSTENKDEETFLAKVTKSVGNEISVNLSKEKFELQEGLTVSQGNVNVELTDSQKEKLVSEGIASEGDESEEQEVEDIFGAFTFDAGSKDYIISAGVAIFDARVGKGKEGKVTDIKQGSVLNIKVNKNTNTVTRIDILE